MKLRELLAALPGISFDAQHRALDAEVTGLSTNSHACQGGRFVFGNAGNSGRWGRFLAKCDRQWCNCRHNFHPSRRENTPPTPP